MPFADYIGHQRNVEILRREICGDHLSHALLFCGPQAVGKRFLAKQLAAAINCLGDNPGDWCGCCRACRQIMADQHPDVRTLGMPEEKSNKSRHESADSDSAESVEKTEKKFISMAQMKEELIDQAFMMPFHARKKVFILENAEAMVEATANTLLKTLEEPPDTSLLILITSYPDALLPTIRSRCQIFRFSYLSSEEVARIVQNVTGCSRSEAQEKAAWAEGAVDRALHVDPEYQQRLDRSAQLFLEAVMQRKPISRIVELLAEPSKDKAKTKEWLYRLLYALRKQVTTGIQEETAVVPTVLQAEAMSRAINEVCRGLVVNINRQPALENLYLTCREIAKNP